MSTKKKDPAVEMILEKKGGQSDIQARMEAGKVEIMKVVGGVAGAEKLAELIERQQGSNFTQKFENLVTRCMWELPTRERELEQLEARIQEKREQLRHMSAQTRELSETLRELLPRADALAAAVDRAEKKWDV